MKRVIIATAQVSNSSIREDEIDTLLAGKAGRAFGPNRYLYAICAYLGWNPPAFLDNAARGVRIRYACKTQEEADETLQDIQYAGKELGIPIYNPQVKSAPRHMYYAYAVVPKYYES